MSAIAAYIWLGVMALVLVLICLPGLSVLSRHIAEAAWMGSHGYRAFCIAAFALAAASIGTALFCIAAVAVAAS
jgi:hypothetical protein